MVRQGCRIPGLFSAKRFLRESTERWISSRGDYVARWKACDYQGRMRPSTCGKTKEVGLQRKLGEAR